jgi:hypothetical protein
MTMARSSGWMRISGLGRVEWLASRVRQFFSSLLLHLSFRLRTNYLVAEKVNRE